MNPILQALSSGYSIKKILEYLSKSSPDLANKISTGLTYGYTANQILKYVMKGGKSLDKNLPNSSSIDVNLYEKMGDIPEEAINAGKVGLGLAAAGAGLAYGMGSKASQGINAAQSLSNTLTSNSTTPTPQQIQPPTMPQPAPISPGINIGQQVGGQAASPVTNAIQPPPQDQIAQASQALPTEQPSLPGTQQQQPIFEQLLGGVDPTTLDQPKQDQLKFLAMISDQLQFKGKTINDPEFKNLAKKIKDVVGGKPGMMVEENARFQAGQAAKQANVNPLDIEKTEQPRSIIEPTKITKPKEIAKGESVVTDNGTIAEVKGTSGNNFLIEENGKIKQVPMDSLRSQPEAIKKAKIVFDPSKVSESEKSAALAFSVPMPDRSAIINMFHDGSYYVYRRKDGKPIDESIIKRIIEGQDIPMTTGETFMGSWNQDTGDSRGSASFKELTAMAQDPTKPDDPSKPLIFEKITNSFTHGYIKEFMQLLKETGKNFSAKPKKPKK